MADDELLSVGDESEGIVVGAEEAEGHRRVGQLGLHERGGGGEEQNNALIDVFQFGEKQVKNLTRVSRLLFLPKLIGFFGFLT